MDIFSTGTLPNATSRHTRAGTGRPAKKFPGTSRANMQGSRRVRAASGIRSGDLPAQAVGGVCAAWCLCLVLVLALGSSSSVGAQPPAPTPALDGLFLPLGGGLSAEIQGALAESVRGDDLVPAGVIRSRRVAIDFALLGERVRGLLGRPTPTPFRTRLRSSSTSSATPRSRSWSTSSSLPSSGTGT